MASSINISGLRQYRPGIYATIDASALGGSGISTGNVAVVGAFPQFEASTPRRFTSAKAVTDFDPTNRDLALLAKLAFAPSVDDRVPGGAASLTVLNVQPTTRAQAEILDSAGGASILLKSKVWGPGGNRVYTKHGTNAADADALDLTIIRNGVTEAFTKLQSGPVGTVNYTGSDLTTCTLEASPEKFEIKWTRALAAKVGGADLVDTNTDEMISAGAVVGISLGVGAGGAHAASVTVKVEGLDETGTPVVGGETVTLIVGTNSGTTTHKWSRIDKITVHCTDNAWVGITTLSGVAFDFTDELGQLSAGDIFAVINQNSAKGFEAEALHIRASKISADELDATGVVSIKASERTLRADTWAVVTAVNAGSNIVEAVRATGGTKPPAPMGADPATSVELFLMGGSVTAPVTTQHWIDALLTIAPEDIQIVVPMSQALAVHKACIDHCTQSALLGFERNVWVGCTPSLTLQQCFDQFTSKLNTRYVALVGQQVQVDHPDGTQPIMDPEFLALICAGMQAGTDVATPLTFKRPDVVNVIGKWNPVLDANEAIQKGIVNLSRDSFGWRVERSVTTYMLDDNPIFSEVSAFESCQTSVRDLRAALLIKIGEPIRGAVSPKRLAGIVSARLDGQVERGIIKAWRNLLIEDLGDRFRITYQMAAVEPLNFIEIIASVIRIPMAA
jgi:hypothetical protein